MVTVNTLELFVAFYKKLTFFNSLKKKLENVSCEYDRVNG